MRIFLVSIFLLLSTSLLFALNQYPLIERMDSSDLLFKQLSEDISSYYRNSEQRKELRPLQIYSVLLEKDSTIFALAARFNLPYETITTLNRINRPQIIKEGSEILIPNTPGLFVPLIPVSDIEYMIRSWRSMKSSQEIRIKGENSGVFYFLSGEKFHQLERTFFLGIMFRFPLPKGIITSPFGERINPLTGKPHFHNGIDIAAPLGTEILASRGGKILNIGFNDIYGNFITIEHEDNYETVYCHLKKIFVELNQKVQSGMIIATVGTTGMSTGPHLHFEILGRGQAKDPILMIAGKKQ